MIEKTNNTAVAEERSTNPRIASTIAMNVATTAANCGLVLKGEAMKNDQLARTNPRRTWTARMRAALVFRNSRYFQIKLTAIHAGR
jgi:uncharacterized protein YhbP (UPF0306 family)